VHHLELHDLAQHRVSRFGGAPGVALPENWRAGNATYDERAAAGGSALRFPKPCCILLMIVVGAALGLGAARAEPIAPRPNDAQLVARGKAVYEEQCARCPGSNLEGQPAWRPRLPNGRMPAPPHDPTGHTWHHSDKQLFDMTKVGPGALVPGYQSDMPGFKDKLSDADIWAVLSYIESTWPPDIRAKQQRMTRT